MKRLIALGFAALLSVSGFAQGTVRFTNKSGTNVDAKISIEIAWGVVVPCSGADTTLRAALLGGPPTSTPYSFVGCVQGTLSMLASPNSGTTWVNFRTAPQAAGYVNIGADSVRDSGLPYGSTGLFQVVAWRGNYDTWAEAWAAAMSGGSVRIGVSTPVTCRVSSSVIDPNVPLLVGLQPFTLWMIPEPSTLALAGLSAAVLIVFHSRREAKKSNPM